MSRRLTEASVGGESLHLGRTGPAPSGREAFTGGSSWNCSGGPTDGTSYRRGRTQGAPEREVRAAPGHLVGLCEAPRPGPPGNGQDLPTRMAGKTPTLRALNRVPRNSIPDGTMGTPQTRRKREERGVGRKKHRGVCHRLSPIDSAETCGWSLCRPRSPGFQADNAPGSGGREEVSHGGKHFCAWPSCL